MTIELGRIYSDQITGFTGVAIGRAVYLYGEARVALAQRTNADAWRDPQWFSEDQLLLQEGAPVVPA